MIIINPNKQKFSIPPEYVKLFKVMMYKQTIKAIQTKAKTYTDFKATFYYVETDSLTDGKIFIKLKEIEDYDI